jgi:DNA-binding IclR family transcriptional regulator
VVVEFLHDTRHHRVGQRTGRSFPYAERVIAVILTSVNSALMALRAVQLVAQRGSLTVSELAAELHVAKSTAHRVLANCVAGGFVRQDHVGGPYVTGMAVHELALTATSAVRLRDAAQRALENLRDETGMTASVLVLEGRTARFVQSLEGSGPGRASTRLGRTLPAHCTSGGKAMLAFLPEAELCRRYPTRRLERITDRSITDWDALVRVLAVVRARCWAANLGETDPAVTGVGAPVLLGNGDPVAAVCLAATSDRLHTRSEIDSVVPPLLATATRIQSALRGAGPT